MHVVYKLTFIQRKEDEQYPFQYIGTKSNCDFKNDVILDKRNKPYFGSSKFKNYKQIVSENMGKILVEILYIGKSYHDCLLKERELHIDNNVVMSPEYFNNMIAIDTNFHDPDYVMMKNILSGKCCRIHKDHSDIINGLWVGITTGTSWYNNGIESKTFSPEEVPDGWVKGRLWNLEAHNKGKPQSKADIRKRVSTRMTNGSYIAWNKGKTGGILSEETKQKMSLSRKGRKGSLAGKRWITNGVENSTIDSDENIPDGWRYGQTKSTNKV